MKNKIPCDIDFYYNKKIISSKYMIIENYKNQHVFDRFKKKLINEAIKYNSNCIKIRLNGEEDIEFFITPLENLYLVEVYNILNNEKHYIETLKFQKNFILPYRYYNDFYWLPLISLPIFFFF